LIVAVKLARMPMFALDCDETRQRKRHAVGANGKINDGVLTRAVRDGRSGFFDQHRTGGFHGHSGYNRALGILDHAANRTERLCMPGGRNCQHHENTEPDSLHLSHGVAP
jgi:hypothetical protein